MVNYKSPQFDNNESIQKIENSISSIRFKKNYVGNNHRDAAFMIQMKDTESAQLIKNLIENSDIGTNKIDKGIKVELQNDKSRNRENLLTMIIKSTDDYSHEFQNIINKLINSEYLDKNFQKVAEKTYPLLIKEYIGEDLNDEEFNTMISYQENMQKDKQINTKDFLQFLQICQQNQEISSKNFEKISENSIQKTNKNPY